MPLSVANSLAATTSPTSTPNISRLARRNSTTSLTSLAPLDKETIAQALDEIHTTASQSSSLTVFNDYASPPAAAGESLAETGRASDALGSLTGFYAKLRHSVISVAQTVDDSSSPSPQNATRKIDTHASPQNSSIAHSISPTHPVSPRDSTHPTSPRDTVERPESSANVGQESQANTPKNDVNEETKPDSISGQDLLDGTDDAQPGPRLRLDRSNLARAGRNLGRRGDDLGLESPSITSLQSVSEEAAVSSREDRRKDNKLLDKHFWMKDENAKDCFFCGTAFNTFRRKHHCRTCGQIFDAKCTTVISGSRFAQSGTLRVCLPCEGIIREQDDSSDLSDDSMSVPGLRPRHGSVGQHDRSLSPRPRSRSRSRGDARPSRNSLSLPMTSISTGRRSTILEVHPDKARPSSKSHFRRQLSKSHLSIQTSAPFPQSSESGKTSLHTDEIIDPDLAAYLSDEATSGDEQMSIAAALKGHEDKQLKGRDEKYAQRSFKRRGISISSNRPSPRSQRNSTLLVEEPHARMIRSSSMIGPSAPAIEMNRASLNHVIRLLNQLLSDASIPNAAAWEQALIPMLLKSTDNVKPNVQAGDDMDVRHYVKFKKIPGGSPSDTAFVSGLVFTKNLALKSMPRIIDRPNILILTFPLEYARHQQHFLSLEPVIRQEREFLQNLVNRIAALRPHLLLVERHVSGLALSLLDESGIATACNVKKSVLEAVSRCCQTRVVSSIDKLALTPVSVGKCASFYLRTYCDSGRRKTYMFLSGCEKELGCTIVLRGADNAVLTTIKRLAEFMVYVVYSLKLETSLMQDEAIELPTSGVQWEFCEVPAEAPPATETADEEDEMPTFYTDMVDKHRTKLLSASPFVKFMQPYLLTKAREQERRLAHLKRLRDQHASSTTSPHDGNRFEPITPQMVNNAYETSSRKVREVLHAVHDAEYDKAMHTYLTQSRQWESYIAGNVHLFDPYSHQSIAVLYSLVCSVTTVPCSGPDLFNFGFYDGHSTDTDFEADCTLGQYVEDLCLSADHACLSDSCEKPLREHHRQYVHGEAQLSVFVEDFACPISGLEEQILIWSACRLCDARTEARVLSSNAWRYSFGKYLELSFWGHDLRAACMHDLHRDFCRYFGLMNRCVKIQYDPINLLEIIVPRARITWKVDNDLVFKNDIFAAIDGKITRFMSSVLDRIHNIKAESVLPEKTEACRQEIARLQDLAEKEQRELQETLQQYYMNSLHYEIVPLNRAIRATQEKVAAWDERFIRFDQDYFPSEKDIRRLAAVQLRKMFESEPKPPPDSGNELDLLKVQHLDLATEDPPETPKPISPTSLKPRHLGRTHSQPVIAKDSCLIAPQLQSVSESEEEDRSKIPRSVQPRVSHLAQHFEQLSRKFEKERIKERRQRALSHRQSNAHPMKASRAIVQVYKNMHEAVEERGPSDEDLTSSEISLNDVESSQILSDEEGPEPFPKSQDNELSKFQDNVEEPCKSKPDEGEQKTSLIKMLSTFWAERSASGWQALEYPLLLTDHMFADSDVIVREDEPSSLIALALGSDDYRSKLESNKSQKEEESLLQTTGLHLKYQFSEGSAKMLCKVFYAEQFDALRRQCGAATRFVESLSRCMKWDSKGGKTKSVFLKTLDQRFVLKSLSTVETQAFLKFAPAYFQIMSETLFHDLPSVIAKMFGFYQIIIRNPATGIDFNCFMLVMENLFYDRTPTRLFDLKGSMRNRRIESTGEENEVLLDENMVEFIYESPLFAREHSKKLLRASVWNDTLFLSRQNVMDYSLMIAVDKSRRELVVGIIDCIRTYTWDKKLESWIKDRGKNRPTVTSPKEYKSRFREAMSRYVLQAPKWVYLS